MPAPTRPSPPLRGLFVAGSDTAVGKTVVSTGILRLAVQQGLPALPYKPAESGVSNPASSDAARLREAARRPDLPLAAICPFPLRPALAPAAAGLRAPLAALVRGAHRLHSQQGSPLLVESAGGLLSPYTLTFTSADLAVALRLPVLLVARNTLGTINHTALSVEAIRARRLNLVGILLVDTERGTAARHLQNSSLIRRVTGITPLGRLPFLSKTHPDHVAQTLRRLGLAGPLLHPFRVPRSRGRRARPA